MVRAAPRVNDNDVVRIAENMAMHGAHDCGANRGRRREVCN